MCRLCSTIFRIGTQFVTKTFRGNVGATLSLACRLSQNRDEQPLLSRGRGGGLMQKVGLHNVAESLLIILVSRIVAKKIFSIWRSSRTESDLRHHCAACNIFFAARVQPIRFSGVTSLGSSTVIFFFPYNPPAPPPSQRACKTSNSIHFGPFRSNSVHIGWASGESWGGWWGQGGVREGVL